MTTPLLKATGLYKSYHDGERELKVITGVDIEVYRGEAVAVIGMSGTGKSTLLHLLGALDVPDRGSIIFEDREIVGKSSGQKNPGNRDLNEYRNRHIGYLFQFHHLLPEFTALENVMMPALIGSKNMTETQSTAGSLLEELELSDRMGHRPGKLSGGEQQRVALARALVNRPALLLADEPTGNLDLYSANNVIRLMWEMTVRNNMGMIIVTHEPSIASRADRILRLSKGKLATVDPGEIEHQMSVGDR
jgi:lipoprotein-releasing system ATP-binding protein